MDNTHACKPGATIRKGKLAYSVGCCFKVGCLQQYKKRKISNLANEAAKTSP